MKKISIGIVAPSSKVPRVEFELGVRQIAEAGFQLSVHPQCSSAHLFFAGKDDERARAFFSFAKDPELDVIWCGRGGYGAMRVLPHLDRLARAKGKPRKKLLVGYSDATVLLEYTRHRWGWSTLHAPMPGMRKFCAQMPEEWNSLVSFIKRGASASAPWEKTRLHFISRAPKTDLHAEIVGGNLAVLTALVGTPYAPDFRGKMLFLEDVDEPLYRIDRMLQQLAQAGALKGLKAILLGNFQNCRDTVASVLAKMPQAKNGARLERLLHQPKPSELKPLRPRLEDEAGLRLLFRELGDALKIPIAEGLPVGHGPGVAALPLGARYRLEKDGSLRFQSWDWKP